MTIEHIAIYVNNLEKSAEFYEKYFEGRRGELYHNTKTGFYSYFISFTDGARLELMHDPLTVGNAGRSQIGFAHIAFSVGSKEKVLSLTEVLRSDGYRVTGEPRTTGDGYFESVILDNEGNKIEITI